MKTIQYSVLVAASFAVMAIGCGNPAPQQSTGPVVPEPTPVEFPETLMASIALTDPVGVVDARKNVEPGAEITVTGFIGGREEPFVDGRAIFTLADSKALTRCDSKPGDSCPTPWDACCDEPEKIKASVATVQVVDGKGMVLKRKLNGVGGIAPGSTVSVKGRIAPGSTSAALIINAEQIHVAPKP